MIVTRESLTPKHDPNIIAETDYLRVLRADDESYTVEYRRSVTDDWTIIDGYFTDQMPPEVFLRGLADQCRLTAGKIESGRAASRRKAR